MKEQALQIYEMVAPDAAAFLRALDEERCSRLDWKPFQVLRQLALPKQARFPVVVEHGVVCIGPCLSSGDARRALIEQAAQQLIPWKKGPFRLFGLDIDAEWRSDFKWERMAGRLPDLEGKAVLDLGCNNGYYMFRMLEQNPRYVLGLDPYPRVAHQFQLMHRYADAPQLEFALWGYEELVHFEGIFDVIFCMGILYHHPDPIGLLRQLHRALKPGGQLVLESIVLPGDDDFCLFPSDRYASMRNVWFVPTARAMQSMLVRTKFQQVQELARNRHLPEEQRTTPWNPGASFAQFLDAENVNLTQEGHPAPWRSILSATKPV